MNEPEPGDGIPVLTEVVEGAPAARAPALDAAGTEALAEQLERALLERLGPEIERVAARALDRVRADLTVSILQMVREAVAASVARARGVAKRD